MKLKLKEIKLEEKTLEDISINHDRCDVQKFIDYIEDCLSKTNALLNCKIEALNDIELYQKLREIFDFTVEKKDYLRALSMMYKKHYTGFINIKTNMLDNNGNNIMYQAASVASRLYLDGSVLDLNSLRKLIDRNEILIIKTLKVKPLIKKDNLYKEKYESHQFIDVDITNCSLEPNNELFLYFIEILKKDILVKDILHDIKLYIDELMFQAKSITKLSNNRDNPQLALIGEKYKREFDKQISFKNTKVSKTRRKAKK